MKRNEGKCRFEKLSQMIRVTVVKEQRVNENLCGISP